MNLEKTAQYSAIGAFVLTTPLTVYGYVEKGIFSDMEFTLLLLCLVTLYGGVYAYFDIRYRLKTAFSPDWDRTNWSQDRKDQNIHKLLKDLDNRITETDQQLFDQLTYATLWQISIEAAYANNSGCDFQAAMKYAQNEQARMVKDLKDEQNMSDNQVATHLNIREGTNPASYHQGTY